MTLEGLPYRQSGPQPTSAKKFLVHPIGVLPASPRLLRMKASQGALLGDLLDILRGSGDGQRGSVGDEGLLDDLLASSSQSLHGWVPVVGPESEVVIVVLPAEASRGDPGVLVGNDGLELGSPDRLVPASHAEEVDAVDDETDSDDQGDDHEDVPEPSPPDVGGVLDVVDPAISPPEDEEQKAESEEEHSDGE